MRIRRIVAFRRVAGPVASSLIDPRSGGFLPIQNMSGSGAAISGVPEMANRSS
jgi:hypothetical protein